MQPLLKSIGTMITPATWSGWAANAASRAGRSFQGTGTTLSVTETGIPPEERIARDGLPPGLSRSVLAASELTIA